MFGFKLKYVLGKAQDLLGYSSYQELFDNYANLTKISFDYAVVEQEKSLEVLRYSGTWKDLGTWNTLTEAMEENIVGDANNLKTIRQIKGLTQDQVGELIDRSKSFNYIHSAQSLDEGSL